MTASDPLPWTLDRLVPRLYSAGWPDQPLTAQVSVHAEAVTGEWTFGVINQEPRFVPFEGDEGDPGKAVPDDRSYTLTLAPGGRYRLELTAGEAPGLTVPATTGGTGVGRAAGLGARRVERERLPPGALK